MKKILTAFSTGFCALFFTACSDSKPPSEGSGSYRSFKGRKDYRTTADVYQNESIYTAATQENTKIQIDLGDQRAQLLVGQGEHVAIDTPVCTGSSATPTRPGIYPIIEKMVDKRSTTLGTTYYRGQIVDTGDRRNYQGRRDRFVGTPLPYWMRLTTDGIGIHGSKDIKRTPDSKGSILTPQEVIPRIYSKVREGTPVIVTP